MKNKEPEFMQELHKIRIQMAKEWKKMPNQEFLTHMHKVGDRFKQSVSLRRTMPASR